MSSTQVPFTLPAIAEVVELEHTDGELEILADWLHFKRRGRRTTPITIGGQEWMYADLVQDGWYLLRKEHPSTYFVLVNDQRLDYARLTFASAFATRPDNSPTSDPTAMLAIQNLAVTYLLKALRMNEKPELTHQDIMARVSDEGFRTRSLFVGLTVFGLTGLWYLMLIHARPQPQLAYEYLPLLICSYLLGVANIVGCFAQRQWRVWLILGTITAAVELVIVAAMWVVAL